MQTPVLEETERRSDVDPEAVQDKGRPICLPVDIRLSVSRRTCLPKNSADFSAHVDLHKSADCNAHVDLHKCRQKVVKQ